MSGTNDSRTGARIPPEWAICIGWMSFRYSPQSGNPDVYHDDGGADFADFEEEFGPDGAGVQSTSDPFLEEGPGPSDLARSDIHLDPAWISWRTRFLDGDNEFFVFVEDRDRLSFRHRKPGRDGVASTTCYAPVDLYLGVRTEREVTRELIREMYAYAAAKRGWDEPPPPPPDLAVQ